MRTLADALTESARSHGHLCPRQVLGVRMGLAGVQALAVEETWAAKRLVAFIETDGCFADGISAATGCTVGHRTLRVIDYGKVAVTLVDTATERAIRLIPHPEARTAALAFAPETTNHWKGQLLGYQRMPDDRLVCLTPVTLAFALDAYVSKAGQRVRCATCGEEIINGREILQDGIPRCRSCAGQRYYTHAETVCAAPGAEPWFRTAPLPADPREH